MKPPTFAPAYLSLYPVLAEIAQAHGYTLCVHGSVSRDFDLVAVPWVEAAKSPEELMQALADYVGKVMSQLDQNGIALSMPVMKPHGRLAWTIPLEAGASIDLSVMSRIP